MAASELLVTAGATPGQPSIGFINMFVNSSKRLATIDDAGLVTAYVNGLMSVQASPADPTSTTSSSAVMMGIAQAFTPAVSGHITVAITGTIENNTASDGAQIQIAVGTGTAPTNGTAFSATTHFVFGTVATLTNNANTAALRVPFTCFAIIRGLAVGQAYWVDLTLNRTVSASTVAVKALNISIREFV